MLRLEPRGPYFSPLESLGCRFHASNPDSTKRFFREPPGDAAVAPHVRQSGSFDEALNLLFRDFPRAAPLRLGGVLPGEARAGREVQRRQGGFRLGQGADCVVDPSQRSRLGADLRMGSRGDKRLNWLVDVRPGAPERWSRLPGPLTQARLVDGRGGRESCERAGGAQ